MHHGVDDSSSSSKLALSSQGAVSPSLAHTDAPQDTQDTRSEPNLPSRRHRLCVNGDESQGYAPGLTEWMGELGRDGGRETDSAKARCVGWRDRKVGRVVSVGGADQGLLFTESAPRLSAVVRSVVVPRVLPTPGSEFSVS